MPAATVTSNAKIILLDIEGTTTSISFVKDELFPYVLRNLKHHLDNHWNEPEMMADIDALREQAERDRTDGILSAPPILSTESVQSEIIQSVISNVEWQMSSDRKTTALKQLQGHMWVDAYEKKEIEAHLFEDVASCMKTWKKLGKSICIYSSGSVAAQKLLFKYSVKGDLTELISQNFDTRVGGKKETKSYSTIAEQLGVMPNEIIFLTDIVEEARAAKAAGMQTTIMVRPGNGPLTVQQLEEYETMTDFHQLKFE
ncbi:enolase-phosphatase E1-like [Watersipora subatra]|uniref:enolase-phosphatase E1-like n=1 Tax=Watersipora subatra TaxID=2589382 RepID=UPI00355B8E76